MLDITGMLAESLEAITNNNTNYIEEGKLEDDDYNREESDMMQIMMEDHHRHQLLQLPPNTLLNETIILLPKEEEIILPNDNNIDINNDDNDDNVKKHKRHFKIISKSVSQEFNKRPSSEQSPLSNYYLSYRPSYPPTKLKSSYYKNNLGNRGEGEPFNNNTNNYLTVIGSGNNIKKFKSHSVILSKRSSYFRTALSNNWSKRDSNNCYHIFDKPNISPKVFTSILRYLYFDSMKLEALDIPTILEILIASDELVLTDFINEIQSHFIYLDLDKLRPYIIKILLTTFYNPSFKKLFNYILKILIVDKENLKMLLLSSANELYLLTEDMVIRLLEEFVRKESEIGSEEIWEFSCEWSKQKMISTAIKISSDDGSLLWEKEEYIKFYRTIYNLLLFVKFSNISRNFYFENILPYLKYWNEFQLMIDEEYDFDYEFVDNNFRYSNYNVNGARICSNVSTNNSEYHEKNLKLNLLLKNNELFNHYLSINNNLDINGVGSNNSRLGNIILNDSNLINHFHMKLLIECIEEGGNNNKKNNKKSLKNHYRKFKKSATFFKRLSFLGNHNDSINDPNSKIKNDNNNQKMHKFNLLFRMTRDGLDSYNRNKCLFNNGPTLVITKIRKPTSTIKNNNTIGSDSLGDDSNILLIVGYNPIGLDCNNHNNNKKNLSSQLLSQIFILSFVKFDNIGPTFGYLRVNLAEKSCELSTIYFFDDDLGCLSKNEILECEIFHISEP
ncbi:33_t:CDS:2 [Entrophospora sp. SA101]|nr:33_t:CDS:2 [Entrophospora sp. SA101]